MLPQCGNEGKDLLLDFTIVNPVCESYINATRNDPTSAIRRARTTKNNKYMESAAATSDITLSCLWCVIRESCLILLAVIRLQ